MEKLAISHLTKIVQEKVLLKVLHLHLNAGCICGVIGDNGAGKTTLFRCILGLSQALGTITIDDKLLDSMTYKDFLKRVGYITPLPESFGAYTVTEVFDDHIYYYGCSAVNYRQYLKKFGLTLSPEEKISTLSWGMKQRLAISLACLHNPELLILDEPFNGLDRDGVVFLQQLLLTFKQERKLILISSHSFTDLEKIADSLILLHQGEILATSDVGDIKQQGFDSFEQFYRERKMEVAYEGANSL